MLLSGDIDEAVFHESGFPALKQKYIDIKTLRLLKDIQTGVSVTVFSDNTGNRLHLRDYTDFQTEFPGIVENFLTTGGIMHDRFIVLDFGTPDERMIHCGASSKDAGVSRMTAITELMDAAVRTSFHNVVTQLLTNPPLTLR